MREHIRNMRFFYFPKPGTGVHLYTEASNRLTAQEPINSQ